MLLAQRPVIRRHAVAVVRILACAELVDEVPHQQRVLLSRAEDQRLLLLVDHPEENLHPLFLTLADHDVRIEVRLLIQLANLDLPFHHRVIGGVGVVIHRRLDLLHAEGREETVVDPLFQRIHIHRLAEVGVGVHVVLALRRRRQAELHRRGKVFQDLAPVPLVVRTATVALVDHDEVEEILRIIAEVWRLPQPPT